MGFAPELADYLFSTWEKARGTLMEELKRLRSEVNKHGEKYLIGPILADDLPSNASAGTIVAVSDSDSTTWGDTISGGGTYTVLAFFNGTHWTVIGTGSTVPPIISYTNEEAQDAVGTILQDSSTIDFTYTDAIPAITAIVIDDSITNGKLANMAQSTFKGRAALAGTGDPTDLTPNQASTVLDGATDPFLRTSAATAGYTNEQAQDAVGGILTDTATIDFTYNDGANTITADVITGSITNAKLADMATLKIKARKSGSTGVPEDCSLSEVLDFVTSAAQGDILYRGAATWTRLGAGTAGQYLKTGGAGANPSWATRKAVVGITVDGAGSTLTTGVKGYYRFQETGTITKATVLSTDASVTSGSVVIDVWKDTYANYPPDVSDTIINTGAGGVKPTLSSATKSEDTTLTSWSTTVTAGDVFGFKIDSVTTLTRVTLELEITLT